MSVASVAGIASAVEGLAPNLLSALGNVDPDMARAAIDLGKIYNASTVDENATPDTPPTLWGYIYDTLTTPQMIAVFVIIALIITGFLVLYYRMLHEVAVWASGILKIPPHTLFILYAFTGPLTLIPTAFYAIYMSSHSKRR